MKSKKAVKKYIIGEKLVEPVFSYGDGDINADHKQAVSEVINILQNQKEIPLDMVIEQIKQKFQIKDIPVYDYKKTLWYELTKDERIGANIQGFVDKKDENGNQIKIPFLCFSADIEYLDGMMKRIVTKIRNLK